MATLIYQLSTPLKLGHLIYTADVWGDERGDGLWEGWIEFTPSDGRSVLRTGPETTQSNREALTYWATGLEAVYLDGALARALANPRAA